MRFPRWFFWFLVPMILSTGFANSTGDTSLSHYLKTSRRMCLRFQTADSGGVIGLPYPYLSPSPGKEAMFSELYYWDCFFTNRYELLASGSEEDLLLAVQQVNNLLYLVEKYGFVPNANRFSMLNRSQPPFLSLMVRDIFEKTGDVNWLKTALVTLENEYDYWMENRSVEVRYGRQTGTLNRYGHGANASYLRHFYKVVSERLGDSPCGTDPTDTLLTAANWLAEAESGWDFTPRFMGNCMDYVPVDLNAILANYEENLSVLYLNMAIWSESKQQKAVYLAKVRQYKKAHRIRIQWMNKLMWDPEHSVYVDYHWKQQRRSELVTAASYFPYWLKASSDYVSWKGMDRRGRMSREAASTLIALIVDDCIMPLLSVPQFTCQTQWSFGNVWAPLQAVAVETMDTSFPSEFTFWTRYVALAFCQHVESDFMKSGHLKEKYPIQSMPKVIEEYSTPPMMGWTSAVYRWMKIKSIESY